MSEFHDIKILPLKIPEKEIFLRLGGNIFKTNLGSDQEKLYQKTVIEKHIHAGLEGGVFANKNEVKIKG